MDTNCCLGANMVFFREGNLLGLLFLLRWLGRQMEQADRLLAYISVNVPDMAQFELSHGVVWHVSSMLESKKTIMASLHA